ncbi:translation initiation factor eIF-2B subunit beta [Apiospora phragmitis]|uniref:Translation initiation factor eIF2B subunit beta n=1 Tax=Apiospora phragmitis TaxID=2905665 RepID=A0ABR1TUP4_9PEZI
MAPPKGGYAPTLDKFLDTLKGRPLEASIESLVSLLKRRQIQGSEPCALATAHILLQVVVMDKYTDVNQLLARIQGVARRLVAAQPRELVIGNIVRRVLGLIRDEALENRNEVGSDESISSPSMFNLLADPDTTPPMWSTGASPAPGSGVSTPMADPQSTDVKALRSEVIDGIEEIMDEIRQVDEQVQAYSDIIIHPGDYILVHQPCKTVQRFLTRSKRKCTVFLVVDPSAEDPYASFRKSMAATGSVVVNIMNTGLMAYMSRVNKVILSARAIMSTGGVLVDGGASVIARAARELGRTVIVIGGVYKLSPDNQIDQETATEWGNPSKCVNYSDGRMVRQVTVKTAVSEYVPAELVSTYITNLGAHSRDHLHAIVNDHYKEADSEFDLYGTIRK